MKIISVKQRMSVGREKISKQTGTVNIKMRKTKKRKNSRRTRGMLLRKTEEKEGQKRR
jgi:hypothetical protein